MVEKTSPVSLSPEYPILGLLEYSPAHGYELYQVLTHDLGQIWRVSMSQVYNILNRLESQDYIAGELQEQEKLPARRRFSVTPKGSEHFHAWLDRPSGLSVRSIRIEFLTRLYFIQQHHPERSGKLIEEQLKVVQTGLAEMVRRHAQIPEDEIYNRMGIELRIHQLNALLRWFEGIQHTLGSHI